MDPRDTAPDSWELEEDAEAPAAAAGLPTAFAALNVNAKPFVPNINAPVFVPSFLRPAPWTCRPLTVPLSRCPAWRWQKQSLRWRMEAQKQT
ncbi:eukaryotic peptide chain release factor GTP-binding subunit ERF3A isoform X1 [Sphaeramia orbicularis]|uniref:eukaryotic peptide chain release factor GTP-binding subunit ERF3A isoform X1 n=1 Tax=Sphaeramia orbicularis TaxID=375764 RepID=UPI00117D4170|nr:eukaryotic peptide chain release factor GTP-binding subunit ERF3B-like isoform X1 [Sphaeramia orbicularis]